MRLHASTRTGRGIRGNNRPGQQIGGKLPRVVTAAIRVKENAEADEARHRVVLLERPPERKNERFHKRMMVLVESKEIVDGLRVEDFDGVAYVISTPSSRGERTKRTRLSRIVAFQRDAIQRWNSLRRAVRRQLGSATPTTPA